MRNNPASSSFGRFAVAAVSAVASVLAACGGNSNSAGGSSGSPNPKPSCVCHVDENGVAQDVACGEQSCVHSVSYTCSAAGTGTRGGACTAPNPTDAGADSAHDGPLTCQSYAWCGSGSVKQWNGITLPTMRGGTIANGLYREAYILAEKGTGTTFGDYGSAFLFRDGSVRVLGAFEGVGTFSTNATTLSLRYTANCDDQSGATRDPSTATRDFEYFVDGDGQLFLFPKSVGSDGKQTVAFVYKPQATLCGNLPKEVPASPGDSYVCKVTNCGCTEASNGPASASTCKFVHGN